MDTTSIGHEVKSLRDKIQYLEGELDTLFERVAMLEHKLDSGYEPTELDFSMGIQE